MVLSVSSPSMNRRRALVKGTWNLSFRRSSRKLCEEAHKENELHPKKREVKHVRFNDEELTKTTSEETIVMEEYEIQQCWYRPDEYTKFEKDRVLTAFQYMSPARLSTPQFNENIHSIRGLEPLIDTSLKKRQIRERIELSKALEEEKKKQLEAGTYPNWDGFCSASLKVSRSSRDRAYDLAQEDVKACRDKPVNPVHVLSKHVSTSVKLLTRYGSGGGKRN